VSLVVDYPEMAGWPVGVDGSDPVPRLGRGVGAVESAAHRDHDVLAVQCARHSLGPVLALPAQPGLWVVLTAPDDPGATGSTAMVGAQFRMTAPDAHPLPPNATTAQRDSAGPTRWIVAPGPRAATPPRPQAALSAAWQTAAG